ncbi:MAG: lipoyl synthase, partial [Candidatus Omnitrophica bacterium]|nr:lipoyl synthase [Candidatus Omnitrophota bacterium]
QVRLILRKFNLRTVCEEARCPNMSECFSKKRFTLLILGNKCTRNCRFCFVKKGKPILFYEEEVDNICQAVICLGIKHLVLTSVSRDDLPDKGAEHFARIIRRMKFLQPSVVVEALIPDFGSKEALIELVVKSGLDVLNHNIETVPRLYPQIRPDANYHTSLKVLKIAKKFGSLTKSGLILGLGEKKKEVKRVMNDLSKIGVDILTLGQYLRPGENSLEVKEYINPQTFSYYREIAEGIGFKYVLAGPFVRSSYLAEEIFTAIKDKFRSI